MGKRYIIGIKFFLLIVWAAFVLWKFFQSFPLVNLLEVLKNGFVLFFLLALFTALGRRVLRVFKISFSNLAEECSFSFGLGTGIVIFLLIGLAALQLLYTIVIFGLILVLFALVYTDARYIGMTGYNILKASSIQHIAFIDGVFIVLMGLAGIVTFLAAATPPFFYDALVYHLAIPQQYLLKHGFFYLPYHHFSNFPMNVNMLFMVGMGLSGGMLAKLISWSFAPMTAVAVYGFAKSRWGTQTAILASTIVFLVPGILILSILTSVDLGVMFYSFLSFSALLSWFTNRQTRWLVLCGVFCSLAVGSKYTALVTTCAVIILLLLAHEFLIKRYRFVVGLRSLGLFGLIVLCGMIPWLVKNSVYTGNPIYPLFNSLFKTHVSEQYTYYDRTVSEINPFSRLLRQFGGNGASDSSPGSFDVVDYLKAPWTFTMKTTRAAGKTGVLFLLCLPGVFLAKKMDTFSRYLLTLGLCSFWLWVLFLPQRALRYVFQMFPPLSLATAYILCSLPVSRRGKTLLLGGVSLLLMYQGSFLVETLNIFNPFTYLFSNHSTGQFLTERGVNYYPVILYANKELPIDSKILYIGEFRSYYCERSFLLSTGTHWDDQRKILRSVIISSANVEEVLQKLHQMGITHILVNRSEMRRFTRQYVSQQSYFNFQYDKDRDIHDRLFSDQHLRSLMSEYHVELYEVLYSSLKDS